MSKKRDELWERLGIADISAIPDLTRERLYAAREEIQATPAGAPLRSTCIRLLAEAWKVPKRAEKMLRAEALAFAVEEFLGGKISPGMLKEALDDYQRITRACVDQTMEHLQAMHKARSEDKER